ncbi:MAG: M1 family metallopeptidase [Flavobacteriaceae bacterium]|nr:M1 family metallopeptidase [Flavobacteriaceae bacterium]
MKKNILIFGLISFQLLSAQQIETVDFKTLTAVISLDTMTKQVKGNILFTFQIKQNTDSIFVDAKKMAFNKVKLNDQLARNQTDGDKLWIYDNFKADENYQLTFEYTVTPDKTLYFVGWDNAGSNQIWTQGQGKETSHWLPSFDDVNEKITLDLTIQFNKKYQVIANGLLKDEQLNSNVKTWHYAMNNPMSSYLIALVIGDYESKIEVSKSGIPIQYYFEPRNVDKFEPTYRYSKQIFDFLENEIGIPFPWQNYKMVPVRDFLYAGMENTTLTVFSDQFVIDSTSFEERNFVNVNAHELAHQWFGDLLTAKSSTHHWLQEGFATFYALLAEKEVFGSDYFYWKLYDSYTKLSVLSLQNQGESLLNPKAGSLTYYEKGAWALLMLQKRVGEEAFKKAVQNYIDKHAFGNVETEDFIKEVEDVSGKDLKEFSRTWLEDTYFPKEEASKFFEGTFIDTYSKIDCANLFQSCEEWMLQPVYYPIKQKIIEQISKKLNDLSIQLLNKAFSLPDAKVKQSLAENLDSIPPVLLKNYENLLSEPNFETVETALYRLWKIAAEKRADYLDKTEKTFGFNDLNIKILWLSLAIITPDYRTDEKGIFYEELVNYTNENQPYQIREKAFQYLNDLQLVNRQMLDNLVHASVHPVWQFSKSSKAVLKELLKESTYKQYIEQNILQFSPSEQRVIKTLTD